MGIMLVHNIVTRASRIPEFCLSTTSENHTINRIRRTDKTTHNQPGKMSPHLKRAKYHEITLSLSQQLSLGHINHHHM